MNNKTILILATVALTLMAKPIVAQSAYSDLWKALDYSQQAANAGTNESATYWASHAFDGGGGNHNYSGYNAGHHYNYNGSSITYASHNRRRATNMSNVGLKTSSSGYNQGAELARFYAEQRAAVRAERIRREAERRERLVASYMDRQYATSQKRGDMAKAFIYNNSTAKPLSAETVNRIISNGLSGNLIIDDDGQQYYLPEMLLEGSGKTHETLEDQLKHMSDEEIENLAEDLTEKNNNDEELSDEELDFLIAKALEHKANLEEEITQLEEAIAIKADTTTSDKMEIGNAQHLNDKSNGTLATKTDHDKNPSIIINEFDGSMPALTNSADTHEQTNLETRQNTIIFENNHTASSNDVTSTKLPDGCSYIELLQPSKLKKNVQLVYSDSQRFPLLRKNGKIVFFSDNETEDITAYNLPSEIEDNDIVFVIKNQLICKCQNSVKSIRRNKMKDVFSVSDGNFDIYPAHGESFYFVKHKADSSYVYLFDTQTKTFTKQFSLPSKIGHLAGSWMDCFATSGKMIYHISKETQRINETIDTDVQSIACYAGGAFFSTKKACYYIGPAGKPISLLVGNIKQLMMINDRLFLLYEDGRLSMLNHADKISTLLQ